MRRHGSACALCGLAVDVLLEATHLVPVADGGTDDPRNSLILCRNHHRAFDAHLFAFDPANLRVHFRKGAPSAQSLGINAERLTPEAAPHSEALKWRWSKFHDPH